MFDAIRSTTLKKQLLWLPGAALALALAGQVAIYQAEMPVVTASASWKFKPASLAETRDKASSIVQAEVVSVAPGPDLVVPASGEPTGEDRLPTQRVQVKVKKAVKGGAKAGDVLEVFQTGGKLLPSGQPDGKNNARLQAKLVILEGDPLYQVGEEYLLFLEDGPRGMKRAVSPEGRFRVERAGALVAMVQNDATKELHGKAAVALERELERVR
jgi:hypothetical protein